MRLAIPLCLLLASAALAGELPKKERKALEKELQRASDPADLARVVTALAADDSKRAVGTISTVALRNQDATVYKACVAALATLAAPKATAALFKPLAKPGGDVRRKILTADVLALRSDPASLPALAAALASPQPEVLRAVLAALERRASPEAVEPLIDLFDRLRAKPEEADGLLNRTVYDLLVALTGRGFDNGEDWRKYWLIRKEQGASAGAGEGTGERAFGSKAPTFFGSELRSNRLVFVIDASNSMEGKKLDSAKEQLELAIDGLGPRSTFTIIAFARQTRLWNRTVQPASPENKASAKAWVDALSVELATFSLLALQTAFALEGPDAIVFLTDGRPTDRAGPTKDSEKLSVETILEKVAALNRWKRWRIDTFGFLRKKRKKRKRKNPGADDPTVFLEELAKQNGGSFTRIR